MIYPDNFENKIGFTEIRQLLRERCLSTLGKEEVDRLSFSVDARVINNRLRQVSEFRHIQEMADDFPLRYFYDVRPAVSRIRLEGTHLEEPELFDLRRSLETIGLIVAYLHRDRRGETSTTQDEETEYLYPTLQQLASEVRTFPDLVRQIDQILDKYGKIKDSASADLLTIRRELAKTEGSISRVLSQILRSAQSEGLVDKDSAPTIRDGRLVIPVAPAMKRKIKGIVHDESATGKTVYIEPAEPTTASVNSRQRSGVK